MKRLTNLSYKRHLLHAGLLAGLALPFLSSVEQPAQAGGDCNGDQDCSFKLPNFMIVLDYSTSMNNEFNNNATRWEAAVDAVNNLMDQDNGFFQQNMRVGLMRYGHDPSPGQDGTTIPGDASGITDGQSLDVAWDDDQGDWFDCNGDAIKAAVNDIDAPMDGNLTGIGTWTNGAMVATQAEIVQTKADHPEDNDERFYANLVMTDGAWTNPEGSGQDGQHDPGNTAEAMFNDEIPTYVVAISLDNDDKALADDLAAKGGTGAAIAADNPADLNDALLAVVQDIKDGVIIPECTGGMPRIMIILDGSSSMLNVGNVAGMMGKTGWDEARSALAGNPGIFDIEVEPEVAVEDLVQLGLLVYGHNAPNPGEQKLLVQYGPCMKDNFDWALDPETSCDMPGCDSPWDGPSIDWTFKDPDSMDYPGFFNDTYSHMPSCQGNGACSGSGTYTHLGLELAASNQAAYHAEMSMEDSQYPADDSTEYLNILITDGRYDNYSTDAQVQAALEGMYASGITTYVIGFGDGLGQQVAIDQLDAMADWGSGDSLDYFDANNQNDLENALKTILEGVAFDPCCGFNDCSENGDPEQCGDSEVNEAVGEECDDGNHIDGDGCSSICRLEDEGGETGGETGGESGEEDTGEEDTGGEDTGDTGEDDTGEGESGEDDDGTDDEDTGDEDPSGSDETGTDDGDDVDPPTTEGCDCSAADANSTARGTLTGFLGLMLFGFIRRRRARR